jgi:acyl-CoA hydrolase
VRVVSVEELEQALGAAGVEEPRVVASGNHASPRPLLAALERSVERYRLFMLAAQGPLPDREGVVFETPFVGPGMRGAGDRLDYLPMRLSLVPRLFATARAPDIVLLHASMPRAGKLSLGIEVNVLVSAVESVRARGGLVVAQLNPRMPYTRGDSELDLDAVDLAIEVDEALDSPEPREIADDAEVIAECVAQLVDDGATLQLGIGQIPDATLRALAPRRNLAIWSEMISDGVMELDRGGALESQTPIVCSFLFGSPDFYEWVAASDRLQMRRTETTNDPARIAAHRSMVSVNSALTVDLRDQAGASHIHGRLYSGFGGQPDFVVGALHSRGGHAVIALRSWHAKSDSSTIVPLLADPVTSFQHSAVITEQGTAQIFGRSQRAQARLIIDHAAHPDARDWLAQEAAAIGLASARRWQEGLQEPDAAGGASA